MRHHKDTLTRTLRLELIVLLAFVMGIVCGILLVQYKMQKNQTITTLPAEPTVTTYVRKTTTPTRAEVIRDWRPL